MQRPGVKGAPTPQQLFSGPAQFSPCPRLASRGDDQVMAQNRVANGLYDALRRAMPLPSSRIYFTTTGYVSSAALDYYFRRDTLHALNIGDTPFSDNLAIHQRAIDSSEFVIASEPGNGIAFGDFLKSERVQTQTLDMVRLNPDFKQIAAFTALNDRHYFLFQRTRPFLRLRQILRPHRRVRFEPKRPALRVLGNISFDNFDDRPGRPFIAPPRCTSQGNCARPNNPHRYRWQIPRSMETSIRPVRRFHIAIHSTRRRNSSGEIDLHLDKSANTRGRVVRQACDYSRRHQVASATRSKVLIKYWFKSVPNCIQVCHTVPRLRGAAWL